MATNQKFKSVEEYINSLPLETKTTFLSLRTIIMKAVPNAEELINYDIPAYALVKGGKRDKQIMVAGYAKFVGFYTGTGILEHFANELTDYKLGKASVQFPNNKPLREDLIVRIINYKIKTIPSK